MGDIDGDGQTEVLFAYQPSVRPETLDKETNEVLCFSPSGKIKWRFIPGRPVIADDSGEKYFPPYWIAAIRLLKNQKPGGQRIVVTSFHHMDQPNQVAVLDGHGMLLGEYWHPGWLRLLASADLDHTGKDKILLAGVNNAQHSATLIVFDPDRVNGAATGLEEPKFGFAGLPPGSEEAVVFFPRSCISGVGPRAIRYNMAQELRVTNDRIFVLVFEGLGSDNVPALSYELDYNLNVLSVEPNSYFPWKHAEMEKQGILKHPFTPEDLHNIAARVVVRRNGVAANRRVSALLAANR